MGCFVAEPDIERRRLLMATDIGKWARTLMIKRRSSRQPEVPPPLTEAEFHTRLLKALERAPKNKVFVFFNSAFTLSVIWGIALAVGGTFFTSRQQCFRDAEPLVVQATLLDMEIGIRQTMQQIALAKATNPDALIKFLKSTPGVSSEFKEKPITELMRLYQIILLRTNRIDFEKYGLPFDLSNNVEIEMSKFSIPTLPAMTRIDLEKVQAKMIGASWVSPDTPLKDFPSIGVDCSVKSVIRRMWTGENSVLSLDLPVAAAQGRRQTSPPSTPR